MEKKASLNISAIALGDDGQVVLSDTDLLDMEKDLNLVFAGGPGPPTNTDNFACTNVTNCDKSKNTYVCINERSCVGSTNQQGC